MSDVGKPDDKAPSLNPPLPGYSSDGAFGPDIVPPAILASNEFQREYLNETAKGLGLAAIVVGAAVIGPEELAVGALRMWRFFRGFQTLNRLAKDAKQEMQPPKAEAPESESTPEFTVLRGTKQDRAIAEYRELHDRLTARLPKAPEQSERITVGEKIIGGEAYKSRMTLWETANGTRGKTWADFQTGEFQADDITHPSGVREWFNGDKSSHGVSTPEGESFSITTGENGKAEVFWTCPGKPNMGGFFNRGTGDLGTVVEFSPSSS